MAAQSNLSQQLGRLSEQEKAISLLEKIRPVIGEEKYTTAKIDAVAASFPDYATFDSEVEVLVVRSDSEGSVDSHTSS